MTNSSDIKISFVVPVYNAAPFLNKCVDSLLASNSKRIEIILIDDGSTDASGSICDTYASKYECIRVKHKTNGGVASARNEGIIESCGDYIFFIDNDDWVDPSKVSQLIELINTTNADLFINKYSIIQGDRVFVGNDFLDKNFINGKTQDEVLTYLRKSRANIMAPWEYVVKRGIIIENNLRFDVAQNGVDDSVFTPMLFCYCKTFYLSGDSIYFWRYHPGSQSKKHDLHSYILKMTSAIDSLIRFLSTLAESAKIDYIYFSLYKNFFALFGPFYAYSYSDKIFLRKYFLDKKYFIRRAARASGLVHLIISLCLGNFRALLMSQRLARLKGLLRG